MKKLVLFFSLALLISCNRDFKQQRAELLVRKYLIQTLALPSFYQAVKFSQLDSVFPAYEISRAHKQIALRLEKLEYFDESKKDRERYAPEIAALKRQDSLNRAAFKVQFGGWSLVHDFRGKDGKDIKELSYKFMFDKNTEYIMDIEFVNEFEVANSQ